jgi:hypothetical protein
MTLKELKDKWGTWMAVAIELKMSQSGITYWRKRGSIPYGSQLVIQDKTKGTFKAKREDDIQPTKE